MMPNRRDDWRLGWRILDESCGQPARTETSKNGDGARRTIRERRPQALSRACTSKRAHRVHKSRDRRHRFELESLVQDLGGRPLDGESATATPLSQQIER